MRQGSSWLPGAIGALIGVAVIAAFGGGVPVDGEAAEQFLLGAATLGRAVTEFVAVGFGLGLVMFGAVRLAGHRRERRAAAAHDAARLAPSAATEVVVSFPRLADATASEFDDVPPRVPASITSLTEAQVERQRAERKRAEHHAGLKGA